MPNPRQILDKAPLCLRNWVYLLKKIEDLTSSNYRRIGNFLLKFLTHFSVTNVYKGIFEFFLFCLDL